ncbi:MAG: site-specific DNA-methyltransferase [Ruminococcus flavefaciens]|nr:site-specific DNA-methyltransferase [Ruminococcus flavefaciens]
MIERNRVYNFDCLCGIREMIEQGLLVDCVITDPPYLTGYKSQRRKNKADKFCKAIQGDDKPQLIIDLLPLLNEVMKNNTPLYMFCSPDKVDFFKAEIEKHFTIKNLIVWDKGNHTAGDLEAQYGKRYEFIIYANKGRAKFNEDAFRYNDIWYFPRVTGEKQIHQNQKPTDLISRIISQHTEPGDLILDAFMGSFSTAVAAYNLQRDFVGFETDEEYFNKGLKRLEAVKNQISIFDLGGDSNDGRRAV